MSKGAETQHRIVRQAAHLFNQKGYSGASISDVMASTGLQKGGIYRHFASKDALATEAFDYAVSETGRRIRGHIAAAETAPAKLSALIDAFTELVDDPAVPGGCPIVNAAIESDDGPELLRERSRSAMKRLLGLAHQIVSEGIRRGEIRPDRDPSAEATLFIALLEGGLLLTRLHGDGIYLAQASEHLRDHIDRQLSAASSPQ